MTEALLGLGIVAGLLLVAWAGYVASAFALLSLGAWLVVGGLAVSVPAGVVYHLRLRAALLARGPLPARWIWSPQSHHQTLAHADRQRVLPWFAVGAVSVTAVFVGCALGFVGALKL